MKSEILALLRARRDYVSGQELCEHFGVSRTAVWKAINQLKKEGYSITAMQNRGYLLQEEAEEEVFGQNELDSRMTTAWAGHPLSFYEEIDSTNLRVKLDAELGAAQGSLVVADKQTNGRGRRGRSWDSPAGKNVYFTLLLRPEYHPERASMVTLIMAMAVAEGIRRVSHCTPLIKWPNDIVIQGKKVCGILTELSVEQEYIHYLVCGVGINVKDQQFAPEIAATATSLEQALGVNISRAELVAEIMKAFEGYYEIFLETLDLSKLMEEYNERLANRGKAVRVLDPKGEYTGEAGGINRLGELSVKKEDGTLATVYAGEVSVRGIYGYV